MENEKKKTVTGLDDAVNREAAEYDLVEALLTAADYQDDDQNIVKYPIKRNGKVLFNVRIKPLSDKDVANAQKLATTYMPNPQGRKYPPIKKSFDDSKFTSWLIYLATVEEDQQAIWGNPTLMKKKGLSQPWESVGALLSFGEKNRMADRIYEISGLEDDDDEGMDDIEFAKNA